MTTQQGAYARGRGDNHICGTLLNIDFELILMPGELVCSTSRTRSLWSGQWSFAVGLFYSWSGGSLNLPYVISPVMECVIGIDILSNYQNPHIGSLTWGVRAIMVGKAKCKPLLVF